MDKPATPTPHAYGWRRPAAGNNEAWIETVADLGGDDFEDVSVLVHVDSFEGSVEIRDVRDFKGDDRSGDVLNRPAFESRVRECVAERLRDAAEARAESIAEQRAWEKSL